MATITVKNIPPDLYDRLKHSASLHRRSINSQVIVCIEQALRRRQIAPEEVLTRARSLRRQMADGPLSVAELLEAKAQGRP